MLPQALAALETALNREDADWRAAVRVIELAGLVQQGQGGSHLGPSGIGPTNAEEIVEAEARRRRRDSFEELLDGGPVTESERRAVLRELAAKLDEVN
jgi:hypothetical protein